MDRVVVIFLLSICASLWACGDRPVGIGSTTGSGAAVDTKSNGDADLPGSDDSRTAANPDSGPDPGGGGPSGGTGPGTNPDTPSGKVGEWVTCKFVDGGGKQRCLATSGPGCVGVSSCRVWVTAWPGIKVHWHSTCGVYHLTTTMDGRPEVVSFDCARASDQPPPEPTTP